MYSPEADKNDEGYDEENDGNAISGQEYLNDAFVFLKTHTHISMCI